MPRLKTDLLELFEATANQQLEKIKVEISEETCVTVMMVSGGYPEEYEKGKKITNLEKTSDCIVFHAGTKNEGSYVVTNGGRVIAVSALANNINEALDKCYKNTHIIDFEGNYFRTDIGFDLQNY